MTALTPLQLASALSSATPFDYVVFDLDAAIGFDAPELPHNVHDHLDSGPYALEFDRSPEPGEESANGAYEKILAACNAQNGSICGLIAVVNNGAIFQTTL